MAKRVHAKSQTDAAAACNRCRLLLVDDNPDDRALVVRKLRKDVQELEVTEALDRAALDRALKTGGFDLVITDFHLRWITGLSLDSRHVAVVSAVVAMSRAFGLEVVAEGIEELRQVENLRSTGCHVGQGFFYSRPVSADSCAALLRAGVIRPRLHG